MTRQTCSKRTAPNTKKLRVTALNALFDMMSDDTIKPSDRLNAIKVVLDYTDKADETALANADNDENNLLRVVFENIPPEYAE